MDSIADIDLPDRRGCIPTVFTLRGVFTFAEDPGVTTVHNLTLFHFFSLLESGSNWKDIPMNNTHNIFNILVHHVIDVLKKFIHVLFIHVLSFFMYLFDYLCTN